ncbi:hypothetical protein GTO89_05390 [Heliobacterium gestii]|uniref:Prepilin type IV endopeptidase peptidase domain-containing protein n=1 Tax=Heliomicrobium gestii TaxID=2699 RepID=A0A845LG63_HELGE|nr:prepilin peptidase [Heliomicrobium gestii]MBM7866201.1 prepilin peptidase CpaA [Heliomicrobium gestii]MZP42473.1 hypothetical protein [Heliomicrobium gestii]
MTLSLNALLLSALILSAGYCDLRYGKIYNKLNLAFFLTALAANSILHGFSGFLHSLAGAVAGLLLLLIPFFLGWVGGGDVKFLAAAGAFTGPLAIAWSAAYGILLFGIVSCLIILIRGGARNFFSYLITLLLLRQLPASPDGDYGRLPLGLFLGLGIGLHCGLGL